MKFFIMDFFSKCDKIRKKLRIWSHLRKKSLMENFIFCAVEPYNFSFNNRSSNQLYLTELLGFLTSLGMLNLLHLIYPSLLIEFGTLVFSMNSSLMELQVGFLALFWYFSITDGLECGSTGKSSQQYLANVGVHSLSCAFPTIH